MGLEGEPKEIAVSVHTRGTRDTEAYCAMVESKIKVAEHKLRHERNCVVHFFNAESEGCWLSSELKQQERF
jgi:hypothetical protein